MRRLRIDASPAMDLANFLPKTGAEMGTTADSRTRSVAYVVDSEPPSRPPLRIDASPAMYLANFLPKTGAEMGTTVDSRTRSVAYVVDSEPPSRPPRE